MTTLATNATSKLTVTGLIANNATTLRRSTAPSDLVTPLISPATTRFVQPYKPAPPRMLTSLPPPGDVCLELTLDELIGSGGTGHVYSVTVSGLHAHSVPPLVAKVARRGRRGHLAREAWFYDELAALQGVSFARCFGWFEAKVEDGTTVIPWKKETQTGPSKDSISSGVVSELRSWGTALASLGSATNVISVLLLERLSDEHLPSKVRLDETFRKDVMNAFDETGHLGVQIRDIRYSNILRAPDTLPGHLPSLPSPFTGNTYAWRIVDLERCQKSNFTMKSTAGSHHSWLRALFDALEKGLLFESWMLD